MYVFSQCNFSVYKNERKNIALLLLYINFQIQSLAIFLVFHTKKIQEEILKITNIIQKNGTVTSLFDIFTSMKVIMPNGCLVSMNEHSPQRYVRNQVR